MTASLKYEPTVPLAPIVDLNAYRQKLSAAHPEIKLSVGGQELGLSSQAMEFLLAVLKNMAEGRPMTLIPNQADLTTQQAADLFGCSRPFLVALLEKGEIPFYKVGSHRRVKAQDLFAFKKEDATKREENMRLLAEETQALGIEY